jgi:hypothetical protein
MSKKSATDSEDPTLPHVRQFKAEDLRDADLSQRDSVKVAQHPAAAGLGNDAKRHARPARDDRTVRL